MNDPYLILGVPDDADDQSIDAAYLAGIRACPPDRDPARFEALRGAYEKIRTRRNRLAYKLFDTTVPDVEDVLERLAPAAKPRRPSLSVMQALLRGDA